MPVRVKVGKTSINSKGGYCHKVSKNVSVYGNVKHKSRRVKHRGSSDSSSNCKYNGGFSGYDDCYVDKETAKAIEDAISKGESIWREDFRMHPDYYKNQEKKRREQAEMSAKYEQKDTPVEPVEDKNLKGCKTLVYGILGTIFVIWLNWVLVKNGIDVLEMIFL